MRRAPFLVALFLAALALRPQLVGIGPLLPPIQHDLGVTHAVAGLLGTIPVLCMGLFAPPAPFLSGRIGSRLAIAGALALIGVFGVVRALAPGAAGVVLLTFPIGIGMGLAGAMLPVAVKERFADRPGFATGVYTSGITIGSALAAALAVPLAHVAGGWRTPLLVFGAVSTVLAVALALADAHRAAARAGRPATAQAAVAQRPLAWRLVAAFFLMSSVFYGLNAWLPDAYVERGWSESSAGRAARRPEHRHDPGRVRRRLGRRPLGHAPHVARRRGGAATRARCSASCSLPGAGWVWAVLLGVAIGPLFPLTMTLPLDARRAARPRSRRSPG